MEGGEELGGCTVVVAAAAVVVVVVVVAAAVDFVVDIAVDDCLEASSIRSTEEIALEDLLLDTWTVAAVDIAAVVAVVLVVVAAAAAAAPLRLWCDTQSHHRQEEENP